MPPLDFNSDDFQTLDDVPVFQECTSKQGVVSASDIDDIVGVNNALVSLGEVPVIHIGHSKKDSESPVLGFMTAFKAGLLNGLRTVFATYKVFTEKAGELKYYPRRSVEIYHAGAPPERRWKISSVALLGSNEPYLNLGAMYSASDREHLAFFEAAAQEQSMSDPQDEPVSEEFQRQWLSVFCKTDAFAWLQEQMKAKAQAADDGGLNGEPKDEPKDGEAPKKDGEPGAESQGDEDMNEKEKEEFSATRQRLTTTEQELAKLKLQLQRSEREKSLFSLQNQGCDFDLKVELEDATGMDDAQFAKHLARIQRFAPKAPINQHFSVATVDGGGATRKANDPNSEQFVAKVKAHAQAKGIPFERAYAELQGA